LKRPLSFLTVALVTSSCLARGRVVPLTPVFPIAPAWRTMVHASIEPPLATDGARVFVATREGAVQALGARTGNRLWELGGRPGVLAASGAALVLREPGGTVWSMDPATGSARWKVETQVTGRVPPVIDKDMVIVAGEGLVALRLSSGDRLWSDPAARVSAPPVAWGPWILSGDADGALRCRDSTTGTTLWSFTTGKPLAAPPVVDDRRRVLLGTSDRRFVALSLDRKGGLQWTWRLGAAVQAPPVTLGSQVLFASHEDVLFALDRAHGSLSWRATLPSRPLSGPVLRGNAVLVACFGARSGETLLVEFDGRTGIRQGDLRTPGEFQTAPLLIGDLLVAGLRGRDGEVVALRLAALDASNP
jgi:outer membrane protein assembly factor BamB